MLPSPKTSFIRLKDMLAGTPERKSFPQTTVADAFSKRNCVFCQTGFIACDNHQVAHGRTHSYPEAGLAEVIFLVPVKSDFRQLARFSSAGLAGASADTLACGIPWRVVAGAACVYAAAGSCSGAALERGEFGEECGLGHAPAMAVCSATGPRFQHTGLSCLGGR